MQVHLTRLTIIVVGAAGQTFAPACADYERRLGRYVTLEVVEVKGEPLQRGEQVVREAEGERILRVLDRVAAPGAGGAVVVCDPRGRDLTSEQLAEQLLVERQLALVIGGAAGIDERVHQRATAKIAFGRATMPHQLARVVATEQLYRSFRIARGEPYHH